VPLPGVEERKVWGDGGYQGQTEAIREVSPKAQDTTCRHTKFKDPVDQFHQKKNRSKFANTGKVEHPFRILKRVFGFDKVRYKGIAKYQRRLCVNFALVNLDLHRTPSIFAFSGALPCYAVSVAFVL
jgi:transposase, IS5 family